MAATTTSDGVTTLTWTPPPIGEVRIYADTATDVGVEPNTEMDPAVLARSGRFVGSGQLRVVDRQAHGLVTYTPVTSDGTRAVTGPSLTHLAVAQVTRAAVVKTDTGVVVTFDLPPGVTEALVAARHDAYPVGPHDPTAQTWKVTNTKMQLDGGLHLPPSAEGVAWNIVVYTAVRVGSQLVVAPTGVSLSPESPKIG